MATQTTWQQAAVTDGKEEVKMLSLVSFKINTNRMRLPRRGNDQPTIKCDLHNAAKKWKVDMSFTEG